VEYGQPRRLMNSGPFRSTAMAPLTMRTYPLTGRRAELEERLARARRWLADNGEQDNI
jgi:hypothetical protein